MKAAAVGEKGLELREVDQPRPKANQVLVKVRYAGLNRADVMRAGRAKPGEITIPGMDWTGDVVEVGAEVKNVKAGDRVMCSGTAGYAEYAVTDWGRVFAVPKQITHEEAATLPLALQTMHDALITNGRLKAGESVLIQGASSGVGLMGLQIAKLKGASVVMGSSRNPSHRQRLKEFSCDVSLDTENPAWTDEVLKATGNKGVDVVVDQVSGKLVNQTMSVMNVLGRMVNVGRLGGNAAEVDFGNHALKRISYIGVTFRSRSVEEVREISRKAKEDLWGFVEEKKLRLPIDRVFPLAEAEAAQAHMRANGHFGKILLRVSQ